MDKGAVMNELKPCPFCGGEATLNETTILGLSYNISCANCNGTNYNSTQKEAIKAWNTRADVSIGMSREEAKDAVYNPMEFNKREMYILIDKLYNSIEPKNVVAEFEVKPNPFADVINIDDGLVHGHISGLGLTKKKTHIVTIQEKDNE